MPTSAPTHKPHGSAAIRKQVAQHRNRVYDECDAFYRTAAWLRFRAAIVAERPICEDCSREPSRDVHHKRKARDCPELRLDPDNVLALCGSCHAIRTGRGE